MEATERKAYGTTEAAEMYGVSRATILRMVSAGKLKGHKVTKDWFFSPEELDKVFLGKEKKECC